jgi:hypothetical protein
MLRVYLLRWSYDLVAMEVFTEQLPSNGRLLWLHSSAFELTCHNIYVCMCVLHIFAGKRPLKRSYGRLSRKDNIAIYHRKQIYDNVKLVSAGSDGSVMK